ncbi:glycine cleavage system protein T [Lentzea aerocolonigenes]|uniref:Glycine cleavage system protein T n=1 Tax=Lentzea aerocolonigenes TaxID=68170 RepID=A0A0F0HH64_LENAE|nr:folate-binding protein YgfZ [Lentzea aerocolonigenes]KJK53058.1 glycine cleavage system protein T [Lentzea aerocolonigenes]
MILPGAVPPPDDSTDAGVAWHYGDPFAEQRSAARSVVVVDRSNRGVIAIPGEDRLKWLHQLTSQHFEQLGEGAATEALILDAQGRLEHHMVVANVGGTVFLDVEKVDELLKYLQKMVFWSKVEPRDATAEFALLSIIGPDAPAVLEKLGIPVPTGVDALGEGFVRRTSWPLQRSFDLLVPRSELTDWWQRITDAGARPAGSFAFEALRVEALRPRQGIDTDERTIPHEVNLIDPAVHLNKGCYRGQETVAKVHNVGRPPRRMLLLHLDGSADGTPETGDPVTLDGRAVGRVGSVVLHHELGPIALALVKRSVPVESDLVAGAPEREVQARIDPDSVPPDTPGLGREAVRNLRG